MLFKPTYQAYLLTKAGSIAILSDNGTDFKKAVLTDACE